MSTLNTPDTAQAKVRMGYEAQCGVPADVAVMTHEPEFQDTDLDSENTVVEGTNIVASGHKSKDIPGKATVGGATSSQNDANGFLPFLASGLRNAGPTTDLGNGAYRTTYARSLTTTAVPTITIEQDRNDGIRDINVGCSTIDFTVTIAKDAAMITSATVAGAYQSVWRTAEELHPNPATGSLYLRGYPESWLDRADGQAGNVSLMLVDQFTPSDNVERLIFLASLGQTTVLTGTWSVTAGQAAFTGVGSAAETEVAPGDILDVEGQLLEVQAVTSDTAFTTTSNHTAGAAGATLVREYGSANQATIAFSETKPGLSTQTGQPRFSTLFKASGGRMGELDTAGDRTEIHTTATTGIVAGVAAALTGTVAVSASSATVTGTGTAFISECRIGEFVTTPGDAVGKRILSIASNTSMVVDSDYTGAESGVTMTRRPRPSVALTGTLTATSSSSAVVGVGTLFTTELAVGSTIRTVGGQERRVAAITDNLNLTVHRDFGSTENGVAATTAYEWRVQRPRADWSALAHASGPFPELLSEPRVLYSTSGLPEEELEILDSVEISFTAGREAVSGIGRKYGIGAFDSGSSTGTVTMTGRKINATQRQAILTSQDVRIRVIASTGKTISTSSHEYTWEFIAHLVPTGKPTNVPDTSNQETITGGIFDNPSDPDGYTDALTLIVTSDNATPLATS